MHCFIPCIILTGLSSLAAAKPAPIIERTPAEATSTEETEPTYPSPTLVGISSGLTDSPVSTSGISSYSPFANSTIYTITDIPSTSIAIDTLPPYPTIPLNTSEIGPSSIEDPLTATPLTSSVSDINVYSTAIDGLPPYIVSTLPVPSDTSGPITGTAGPLSTGASSGYSIPSYGSGSLPPYGNSSTVDTYGPSATSGISGISAVPSSTVEVTTNVTISATSTFTSTLPSYTSSGTGLSAATTLANSTYSAPGVSGGSTLGGITANITYTSGVSTSHGPFSFTGYPVPSSLPEPSTSIVVGSSGLSPLSASTGVSGTGTGVGFTALPTYPSSFPNITSTIVTGSTSEQSSLLSSLPTGTGITSTSSNGTTGGAIPASTYAFPNTTSTSLSSPTTISSGYPSISLNATTGLGATPGSSSLSPIDTTCTETLLSTSIDGGVGTTTDIFTTSVTSTFPSSYLSPSFNSTTYESPLTTSGFTTGIIPIPTESPVITYPIPSVPVPTEYYHHHRRPHNERFKLPWWLFGGEDEEQSSEGIGYEEGDDYDYGDDGEYK